MNDVYTELRLLSGRHSKLLNLFQQFYELGAPHLTSNVPGITVGKLAGDRFDVPLAGTTARFVFTFRVSEHGGSKGRVTCYRLDPLKQPETLEHVGHFEFNGEGDTGKKVPSGGTQGDPILVVDDGHAGMLIADLVHKAIVAAPGSAKKT